MPSRLPVGFSKISEWPLQDDYFDHLNKLTNPSTFAKEWTKNSAQKKECLIRNHRPTDACDIPIQFYHRIFHTFVDVAGKCSITDSG